MKLPAFREVLRRTAGTRWLELTLRKRVRGRIPWWLRLRLWLACRLVRLAARICYSGYREFRDDWEPKGGG